MAARLPIPVFNSLGEIYPSDAAVLREGKRWDDLVTVFKEKYGDTPTHVIRAPGRVNILGEHIDYSLFPVLPAAIEQDILIAIHPRNSQTVRLANILPSFKSCIFDVIHQQGSNSNAWHVGLVSPKDGGGWENYVKVAMVEGLEQFFKGGIGKTGQGPKGMDLLMSGTVPPGSGLSSSAAFVVASIITFLVANSLADGVSKGDVVGLAMASEHRMGLRTGGMDQAASALCLTSTLLHLDFHPELDPVPLPLPQSLAVVITNSLAPHELTSSAPEEYNLRVIEVLCATRLLVHAWGLDKSPRLAGKTGEDGRMWLREALEMWSEEKDQHALYESGLKEVDRVFGANGRGETGWTREEMIQASGMSKEDFTSTFLEFLEIRATHFHLHRRLTHTLTESLRVEAFASLCRSLPADVSESDPALLELGKLMNGSHESCRDVYECTVKQTDKLQELCLSLGSLGSRQTGGGWGGAVISLLPTSQADKFLERIKKEYGPYQGLKPEEVEESAFATLPGSGAGFYMVDGNVKR